MHSSLSSKNDKRVLVIAGSDNSGGAGLEADQRVIAYHGCYAMTATTALTAQNTTGVFDVHHIPPSFVCRVIDLSIDDIGVDVVKIGMLASVTTVQCVARTLRNRVETFPIVLDPVMVSTSGSQLLPEEAVSALRELLLPMATIVTPNIKEAKLLAGRTESPDPKNQQEMISLAKDVGKLGPKYVLLKGGHFQPDLEDIQSGRLRTLDVLQGDGEPLLIWKEYVKTRHTHGTGCSLASAIASNIAIGFEISDAVRKACGYVEAGLRTAIPRGKGNGPINHFPTNLELS